MHPEIDLPPGITLPEEIRKHFKLDDTCRLERNETHLWANYSDEWSRTIATIPDHSNDWHYLLRFNGEKKWVTEKEFLSFIKMKSFW